MNPKHHEIYRAVGFTNYEAEYIDKQIQNLAIDVAKCSNRDLKESKELVISYTIVGETSALINCINIAIPNQPHCAVNGNARDTILTRMYYVREELNRLLDDLNFNN